MKFKRVCLVYPKLSMGSPTVHTMKINFKASSERESSMKGKFNAGLQTLNCMKIYFSDYFNNKETLEKLPPSRRLFLAPAEGCSLWAQQ